MKVPPVVWLTVLLLLAGVPHAAEDIQYREFETRFGIDGVWAAAALGALIASQAVGAYFAGRSAKAGAAVLTAAALVWALTAIAVHGAEILSVGEYRHGLVSKALEVAIIVFGTAAAAAGFWELRRTATGS